MNFSHILLYFVCTLVFGKITLFYRILLYLPNVYILQCLMQYITADSYINLNQSEFGPLDVSDSLQIIVLDKIRVITDSIIQLQV